MTTTDRDDAKTGAKPGAATPLGASELDLTSILSRAGGATPGPWTADGPDDFGDFNILHPGNALAIAGVVQNLGFTDEEARANATFIAHAREDVPALCREVERLRLDQAYVANDLVLMGLARDSAEAEADRLRALVPVWRGALEGAREIEGLCCEFKSGRAHESRQAAITERLAEIRAAIHAALALPVVPGEGDQERQAQQRSADLGLHPDTPSQPSAEKDA